MLIAADYPFLDVLWTMIIFFCWVAWIWTLIIIFGDLFSRHDKSGWYKAMWMVLLIILPFLGVLIYLIANGSGMSQRNIDSRARSRRSSPSTCVGRDHERWLCGRDREGQGAARQRRDHPVGVRRAEGQGARLALQLDDNRVGGPHHGQVGVCGADRADVATPAGFTPLG